MKIFTLNLLFACLVFNFFTCAPPLKEAKRVGIGEIYGKVVDAQTGSPLEGVHVWIKGETLATVSDVSGIYSLKELNSGSYTLHFELMGYRELIIEDVEIGHGEHFSLDVELSPVGPEEEDKEVRSAEPRKNIAIFHSKEKVKDRDKGAPAEAPEIPPFLELEKAEVRQWGTRPLRAAAHNDNEEYPFFLEYLQRFRDVGDVYHLDFTDRYIVKLIDGQDQPVLNYPFAIVNEDGKILWEGMSFSNGENVIYPHIMFERFAGDRLYVQISTPLGRITEELQQNLDRITTVKLNHFRRSEKLTLDLLFILDTTGSMGDEIQQFKDNIYSIYTRIRNYFSELPIRFGLILYRDKGDEYVVRHYTFTDDIKTFQFHLDGVTHDGGGDKPEDLQSALDEALHKMDWSAAAVKLAFIIADAPPHLDYGQDFTYVDAALEANKKGIKFYTIGASGLNIPGEYIFRQISALTYSEFIFLTYGEVGESDGESGGGKVSHHTGDNYQSHNLDDLVVGIVKKELFYQLPAEKIVRREVDPGLQERYLQIRLDNLWKQIVKQVDEFTPEDTVVVLAPFEVEDFALKELASYLQQLSLMILTQNRRFKVVERERLEEILKEKGLSLAGLIQSESFEDLYYLLNSQLIFLGDLSYAGIDRVIFMRAVRTKNARVVAAARIRI
ncbi:MAG: hypothetical protein Kow0042_11500 [Calditrichia bacterium]